MLNATQLKEYAQLTQATYAYFDSSHYRNSQALLDQIAKLGGSEQKGANFSELEARQFTARYELLHQSDNNDSSGFSAALFRDKQSNRLIVSFRGTEPFGMELMNDLLVTDSRIGLDGYASPQAIQSFRYIKQLLTPAGQAVQYTTQELDGLKAIYLDQADGPINYAARLLQWTFVKVNILADRGIDAGQGPGVALLTPGNGITFTGHSLGGHLAMLMSRMLPGLANDVVTLNAPDFFNWAEPVLRLFSPGWDSGIVCMEAAGDGISEIGDVHPGTRILLGQENESGLLASLTTNHDKVNSADGLALVELMGRLDARFAADARLAKAFIDQAAPVSGQSYELLLDGLRRMVLGNGITATPFNDGTTPASRNPFYVNISELGANAAFQGLFGKVSIESAANLDPTQARTNFSAFLALRYLTPFVLQTNDSAAISLLKSAHTELTQAWEADQALTAEQRKQGMATYSDEYLADRAAMLTWKNKLALLDKDAAGTPYTDAPDAWFKDLTSGLTIHLGATGTNSTAKPRYIFGTDSTTSSDTLDGGSNSDRLYGGAGDDFLYGKEESDHLEGGAGIDQLEGGEGNDVLVGGVGDDKLTGGKHRDTLKGGAGLDTYEFASGDDIDTIDDSDGLGTIKVGTDTLTGGKETAPGSGVWASADGKYRYSRIAEADGSQTLVVLTPNAQDRILVKRFEPGRFGIALENAPTQTLPPLVTNQSLVLQDTNPNDDPVGSVGSLSYGSWDVLGTGNNDQVTGNSLSDRIDGAGGDDLLDGNWGEDELIGGAGVDRLYGGFDNDRLYALSVVTLEAAISAADTPAANTGTAELLEGGPGEDLLIGAASNWLMGGAGKDTMVGGGGQDLARGDGVGAGTEGGIALGNIGLTDGMHVHLDFNATRRKYSQYVTFTQGGNTRAAENIGGDAAGGAADTILSGAGDDWVFGDDGDDTLVLGAGADRGFGGAGGDTLDGGADDDVLFGDFNHDAGTPTGTEPATEMLNFEGLHGAEHGNDLIDGGAGVDTIWGNGGADTLEGGAGNDEIHGDDDLTPGQYHGADLIDGGADNDRLWGGGGDDEMRGGTGADEIMGDSGDLDGQYHGADRIFGGEGADTIWGNGGDDRLYGEADNDTIDGDNQELAGVHHGKDVIDGGEGDDQLTGWGNDDTIYGGKGNDTLFGDSPGAELDAGFHGEDVLDGGEGNDSLVGGGKADRLYGGAGVDNLRGDGEGVVEADQGNDWLDGGEGDDVLAGDGGDDTLMGGAGADNLWGGAGNDRLTGGAGVDNLFGEGGNDTYYFELGDSPQEGLYIDAVFGGGGNDTIEFGAGVTRESIQLARGADGQLRLAYSAEDRLYIEGGFSGAIQTLRFADGSTVSLAQLIGEQIGVPLSYSLTGSGAAAYGGASVDQISSTGGGSTLSGGRGDDTLTATGGNNLYLYNLGDGVDTLQDLSAKTDANGNPQPNTLRFGAGIAPEDIRLVFQPGERFNGKEQYFIRLDNSPGDEIRISNFTSYNVAQAPGIDRFEFEETGQTLSWAELVQRGFEVEDAGIPYQTLYGTNVNDRYALGSGSNSVYADRGDDVIDGGGGSDDLSGGDGNDTILGGAGNDYLYGDAGDDWLDGGWGSDVLKGNGGADSYILAPDGGWDEVDNAESSQPGEDVVRVAAGLGASDIGVSRSGNDLIIRLLASDDRLTFRNHYTTAPIDGLRFADNTFWDRATLEARANLVLPTNGDDVLSLTEGDDTVDALAGNDTVDARGGNDTVLGGAGLDSLNGGEGNDVLRGGADGDTLSGGNGDDELDGGTGNDQLAGSYGNDTFRFNRGDGYDTIDDFDSTPGKTDRIVFGPGIAREEVTLRRVSGYLLDDLEIRVPNADPMQPDDNKIVVKDFFMRPDSWQKIDEIRFADDSVITLAEIKARLLTPTEGTDYLVGYETDDTIHGLGGNDSIDGDAGNDSLLGGEGGDALYGNAGGDVLDGGVGDDVLRGDGYAYPRTPSYNPVHGNDTLIGGAGNDRLEGGGGDDIYRFGRGQGADRLLEGDGSTNGGMDEIRLDAGIGTAAVSFIRTSDGTGPDDLVLVLDGGGEQLRIEDYFDATQDRRIERVAFDGGPTWNEADIAARIVSQAGTANTVSGTAGNDAFVVDHPQDVVVEAAGQGSDTILSNVGYTLPTNVENLTMTGVVNIDGKGNDLNNVIRGNDGNNRLDGVGGYDQLIGGRGDDVYVVGNTETLNSYGAQVTELAGEGNDTVIASFRDGYTLPDHIENLNFRSNTYYALPGQTTRVVGNALNNTISTIGGWTSANRTVEIDGGGGTDTLIGGGNSDIFILDSADDTVIESGGQYGGFDTVRAGFDYTLGQDIEALVLTGSAAARGTGNALDNTLDGSQNAAANVLTGGLGNDTYVLGVGDTVVELAGEGSDTVLLAYGAVGGTYSLAGYSNIEGLALGEVLGASHLLGGAAGEILTGNNAANTLQGGGGDDTIYDASARTATQDAGAVDVLEGGAGNDRLVSWGGTDVLEGGEGNDTLESYGATYRFSGVFGDDTIKTVLNGGNAVFADLAAWQVQLEREGDHLVMRGPIGTGTITVENHFVSTGSSLQSIAFADGATLSNAQIAIRVAQGNAITEGDDVVLGSGGADTYALLGGNDVAWGSAGDDTITAGAGEDWIYGGDGADRLVGGSGTSYLYGAAGDDVLDAGVGITIMRGGEGADTFHWGLGDGADTISPTEHPAGTQWTDTLQLGPGITPDMVDVVLPYEGATELRLVIRGTSDVLTLAGFFYTNQNRCEIDQVRFDGGAVWTRDDLIARSQDKYGTDGADTLNGDSGNNRLFGLAGNDTLNGLGGNDLLDGGSGTDTLRGGTGDDVYVVDNTGDIVTENANEGTDTVQSSVTWTLGSNVEHLTLTGTAAINGTGNTLANTLTGNSAANVLSGGTGADSLIGGAGNDTYVVDNAADVVTELANEGTDLVQSSVSHTLSANVENLTLTGTLSTSGTGNAAANVLTGNSGANTLNGGAGADQMSGGSGDDIYVVDEAGDVVIEAASQGTDTVQSAVSYTLPTSVENLTLTGTSVINGTGNSANNVLTGNSAANILTGGAGNDTYYVDNAGDSVVELASEGTDLVRASITWTLAANVENLTLTGTAAIDGTGNTLANTLYGNSAANVLSGGSGDDRLDGQAGADSLIGGTGNDTYVVDTLSDVVTENAAEGTDTVETALTYTLGANVENLLLTGTAAVNGTGNTLSNTLTGNSAANVLTGGDGNDRLDGKAGADTLIGGTGNDTYVVDTLSDVVTENAGEGTDTVETVLTYTLGASVENLLLTGTAAVNGTGNALANTLTGNSAANVLAGGDGDDRLDGKAGADTLIGGLGNDTFVVDNAGEILTENAGEGTDTVESSFAWTLAANFENLTLTGSTALNGTGNALDNLLTGNSGINTLTGAAGNDTLNGGSGADTLIGGTGNDTYVVDNAGDVVTELAGEGTDLVQASVSHTLAANVENLTLSGVSAINGTGNSLANVLTGNSATNVLTGGAGDDIYYAGTGDTVTENAGEGTDLVYASATRTLSSNVEHMILTGTSAINGTGNTASNLLRGNDAVNTLTGGTGVDLLEGGLGNDTLSDSTASDRGYFNGGAGTDTLTGGSGAELFIGGTGNDTLNTGAGADVVVFNLGDGQDTVTSSTGQDNTLSLGGGIRYADVSLSKSGANLVVNVGASDRITLNNWYAATPVKSVLTLQMIAEAMADFAPGGADPLKDNKVETFNFAGLANAFDTALAANPGLSSWAITNALTSFHLSGSDTAALGGDLAYQYGRYGNLSNVGLTGAQNVLNNANFGSQAQTLQSAPGLQEGVVRLA